MTSVVLENPTTLEEAERKVKKLQEVGGITFYEIEFVIERRGPYSFLIVAYSDYNFDPPDPQKSMMKTLLFILMDTL